MNLEFPRWTARLNAIRPLNDFTDLLGIVAKHYHVYAAAEEFLSPYNARQRSKSFYTPPSRDELKASIKQGGMNSISYNSFLTSLAKFCETTKGLRALPTPHPSTIHSIQVPEPAFELSTVANKDTITHKLTIVGADPVFLNGVRNHEQIKFIILRPKLSKMGTPSVKDWEVLLFMNNHGYIPHWVDSNINTRWAGKL